jgi:XTP/dITP diphosphohydrolase
MKKEIVMASNNKNKLREVKEILTNYNILSLEDVGINVDVEEDQETEEGNATKKATEIAKLLDGMLCLADDSGLHVEALDGFPGVRTKRWFDGSDHERNLALIQKLEGKDNHKVVYKTAIALSNGKDITITTGEIAGLITDSPRGENGFSFDEIFELPNGKTLAELTPEEKNQVSARKIALDKMKIILEKENK